MARIIVSCIAFSVKRSLANGWAVWHAKRVHKLNRIRKEERERGKVKKERKKERRCTNRSKTRNEFGSNSSACDGGTAVRFEGRISKKKVTIFRAIQPDMRKKGNSGHRTNR